MRGGNWVQTRAWCAQGGACAVHAHCTPYKGGRGLVLVLPANAPDWSRSPLHGNDVNELSTKSRSRNTKVWGVFLIRSLGPLQPRDEQQVPGHSASTRTPRGTLFPPNFCRNAPLTPLNGPLIPPPGPDAPLVPTHPHPRRTMHDRCPTRQAWNSSLALWKWKI